MSGYDFKNDKKKNKDPNAVKIEPPKKREQVEEKEKIVIRQGDPEINLQKLINTEWDAKYLSTSFLAKENANIVFIGHVDSGKSTLTGNILKELKEVDEQELIRNKQDAKDNKMEAWEQAGISDIIPEERQDGKTREFAKLNFSLEKKRFTLFDAPGHKNYVPNMIMGACQADIAVLIISAKEGEF
jgi:peptide chain release factor subunit 3